VNDPAMHGSDAVGTSLVLAAALRSLAPDLVLTGMASTDGGMGVVPAMVAERLGWPQLTYAAEVALAEDGGGDGGGAGTVVTIRRDGDTSTETVQASLPAIVSVTDQINEPRYPSFKGIMAAKRKPVTTWSLADIGVDASQVGSAAAWTTILDAQARPAKQRGTVVTDDGSGAAQLVEFLTATRLV
jgi:electron transfer flavoprotein beta subunit